MVTTLNPSLTFELVGQEALVHDAAGGLVVRLTGDEHSVIQRLTSGEQIVHPTEGEQAAIDRLIEAGIVLDDEATSSRFSRRKVMQLSAAGVAAAGLSYLVLPSAAAAQSGGGGGGGFEPGGSIPPEPDGSTPLSINTNVFRETDGRMVVGWITGSGSAFSYRWSLFESDGTRVATGIATSGATLLSSLLETGFTLPLNGVVRFYVGSTVVDRPVTPP
jgi:hypothetical protein